MSLNSRHSIRFLEVMCKLGTVLTIIPAYDFDKNRIVGRKLYKVYTVTWVLISIAVILYWLHSLWLNKGETVGSSMSFLMFLHECIILALCIIISLGSAFWNLDNWKRLFQGFSAIEKYFASKDKVEKPLLGIGWQFILFTLLLLTNFFYSLYLWSDVKITRVVLVAYHFMLLYTTIVKTTIVYNIALAIKCKYQDLNNLLVKGCSDGRMEKIATIKTVSYLYGLINKLVHTFNKLFGWEILLSLLHVCVLILSYFSFAVTCYSHKGGSECTSLIGINVAFAIVGITTVVGLIQVLFSCHWAIKEAEKITEICYKHQQHFATYSREKLELLILANQAVHNKPAFSAAGFLEINRSTLFALIGTTTTYFIVLIQLNQH